MCIRDRIESLSDVISSLTGRPAGERVPDKVFDQADQVEFVDAEPEKVRECLGNNAADTGVLTALREMALRRMADRINKIAEKGEDVQETSYPGEHILTGISASPSNGRVIRTAARMADAFHGAFTALYVHCLLYTSIKKVTPLTENPHVNLYHLDVESKTGRKGHYYVASRAKTENELKIKTRKNTPDGVIIYSLYGEKKDRVVLVRQYRYAIDSYIYEFPASL